ncbi:FMN-binding protein [Puteibacter caeruleilacunae]|nr:FMN-binding protein [Puteibacter caeruleilacunae]
MKRITSFLREGSASLILGIIILAGLGITLHGSLWGYSVDQLLGGDSHENRLFIPDAGNLKDAGYPNATIDSINAGTWTITGKDGKLQGTVVSSSFTEKQMPGYGGPVPVLLYLNCDSTLQKIQVMENHETPEFIEDIIEEGMLKSWEGKKAQLALNLDVDGLSGATMTSDAIASSVRGSLAMYIGTESANKSPLSMSDIIPLLVIVFGAYNAIGKVSNKKLRQLQLGLNVVVLGVWYGKFLSLAFLVKFVAMDNILIVFPLQVLLVAILLWGIVLRKKNLYCTWFCPFGAAQELLGQLPLQQLKISPKVNKILLKFREATLMLLLILIWFGVTETVLNYEPFAVFSIMRSGWIVNTLAVLFLTLSVFIKRPWCRFVCPLGEILKWSHKK